MSAPNNVGAGQEPRFKWFRKTRGGVALNKEEVRYIKAERKKLKKQMKAVHALSCSLSPCPLLILCSSRERRIAAARPQRSLTRSAGSNSLVGSQILIVSSRIAEAVPAAAAFRQPIHRQRRIPRRKYIG